MAEPVRLPRKLSEEREPTRPVRASHQQVIDHLEKWANSSGLQPPRNEPSRTSDA